MPNNTTDTYIKDRITEIAKEAVDYTPSQPRIPLDKYIERSVKILLDSLIGQDEPLIIVTNPAMNNETIQRINDEARTRNKHRAELRERAGL